MKKILFLCTLIAIGCYSCEEESAVQEQLVGKWDWVSSCGGIAGTTETPESTGDKIELEFTSYSLCKTYKNDTLVNELAYQIMEAESIYDHNLTKMIVYTDGHFRQSFSVIHEELILSDEVYDGYTRLYKRIKE